MDYKPLFAKDFEFANFQSNKDGDSGKLRLATLKTEPKTQYVVKCVYPEDACNEFMYHHTATALGLNTQEARLFKGIKDRKYAVGIKYVPNARKFIHDEATEENKQDFYRFMMLYIILNEDDSEEYYYDEQNKIFKLDNAASFSIGELAVSTAIKLNGKEPPQHFWDLMRTTANNIDLLRYKIQIQGIGKHFGNEAAKTAYDFLDRFTKIDIGEIEKATEALEQIYPIEITEYYPVFIEKRIEACRQFLTDYSLEELLNCH